MGDGGYKDLSGGNGVVLAKPGDDAASAGGTWNVYVVDLLGDGNRTATVHPSWYENDNISITRDTTSNLKTWMGKVAAAASPARPGADCNWVKSFPSAIKPDELYVYLTTGARSKFGGAAAAAIKNGKGGMTGIVGGNVLCEVWPSSIGKGASPSRLTQMLSLLIYHEWMHFKIDIDVGAGDVVHAMGQSQGDSVGVVPIDDAKSPSEPKDIDINAVAKGLAKTYKFAK